MTADEGPVPPKIQADGRRRPCCTTFVPNIKVDTRTSKFLKAKSISYNNKTNSIGRPQPLWKNLKKKASRKIFLETNHHSLNFPHYGIQCGNLMTFMPFRIYVKSFLAAILTFIEALNFDVWEIAYLRMSLISNNSKPAAWIVNMADFEVLKSPKMISRKILMAGKLPNSTLC